MTSDSLFTAVLLPGTGSDDVFVRSVFAGPVRAAGGRLLTPAPVPGPALAEHHLAALDRAAEDHPIVVGGISFGAHLAAEWAVSHPDRCAGLLLALPAWLGAPAGAPAAAAANASADAVTALGTEAALAAATDGVPEWLAAELTRAWRRHGDGLAAGLRAAAGRPAPTPAALATITAPAGIATCTDDPIHPAAAARAWAAALPTAALGRTTLTALADPTTLGSTTVTAWQAAQRG